MIHIATINYLQIHNNCICVLLISTAQGKANTHIPPANKRPLSRLWTLCSSTSIHLYCVGLLYLVNTYGNTHQLCKYYCYIELSTNSLTTPLKSRYICTSHDSSSAIQNNNRVGLKRYLYNENLVNFQEGLMLCAKTSWKFQGRTRTIPFPQCHSHFLKALGAFIYITVLYQKSCNIEKVLHWSPRTTKTISIWTIRHTQNIFVR